MPMQNVNEKKSEPTMDYGEIFFQWEFPEFVHQERSKQWYWTAGLLGGTLLIWSLLSSNFLFALILVITALIIALHDSREPLIIRFKIAEDGIVVGQTLYPYEDLADFFIVYDPPQVKTLHFDFKNVIKQRLSVPLEQQNPIEIRKALLGYLPENLERSGEPLSDYLSRKWKI